MLLPMDDGKVVMLYRFRRYFLHFAVKSSLCFHQPKKDVPRGDHFFSFQGIFLLKQPCWDEPDPYFYNQITQISKFVAIYLKYGWLGAKMYYSYLYNTIIFDRINLCRDMGTVYLFKTCGIDVAR